MGVFHLMQFWCLMIFHTASENHWRHRHDQTRDLCGQIIFFKTIPPSPLQNAYNVYKDFMDSPKIKTFRNIVCLHLEFEQLVYDTAACTYITPKCNPVLVLSKFILFRLVFYLIKSIWISYQLDYLKVSYFLI